MSQKKQSPLKKTGKRIFTVVRSSLKRHNIPPTVREIAAQLDISTRTVTAHLRKLKELGIIKFRTGKNRRLSRGLKFTANAARLRRYKLSVK